MTQPTAAQGKLIDKSNNPQIQDRQSAITAAVEAHSLTDADANLGATTQAEIEGVLDALGTAINSIISVLELHGLIADN